jgi:hypothetical protein
MDRALGRTTPSLRGPEAERRRAGNFAAARGRRKRDEATGASQQIDGVWFARYRHGMPRTLRAAVAGMGYHALNRGHGGATASHKPADRDAFLRTLAGTRTRVRVDCVGSCMMPNHFPVVVGCTAQGNPSRWMQWLDPDGASEAKRPPRRNDRACLAGAAERVRDSRTTVIHSRCCGTSSGASACGAGDASGGMAVVELAGLAVR